MLLLPGADLPIQAQSPARMPRLPGERGTDRRRRTRLIGYPSPGFFAAPSRSSLLRRGSWPWPGSGTRAPRRRQSVALRPWRSRRWRHLSGRGRRQRRDGSPLAGADRTRRRDGADRYGRRTDPPRGPLRADTGPGGDRRGRRIRRDCGLRPGPARSRAAGRADHIRGCRPSGHRGRGHRLLRWGWDLDRRRSGRGWTIANPAACAPCAAWR